MPDTRPPGRLGHALALAAYRLLWLLMLPLALLRLRLRARREPGYAGHWPERLGRHAGPGLEHTLWLHAVSLGEVRAATPLIAAVRKRWPDTALLLTCMTATGRTAAEALARDDPGIRVAWLPYDLGRFHQRLMATFRPRLLILMETELWPNLIESCRHANVPVMLANGRLSERSARRYHRWATLARPCFAALHAVAAQGREDATRFSGLGAPRVSVCGNLKFDATPAASGIETARAWRALLGARPVVMAASTREGEEPALIRAFLSTFEVEGDALLVIVPRHPQRFDDVAATIRETGQAWCRRSNGRTPDPEHRIWLGDSMGEMSAWYSLADIALIGGSWAPLGGQNLIEACALGTPVIVGPHTYNFSEASDQAIAAGAALRATDPDDAMAMARALINHPDRRQTMGEAGRNFAAQHRGATERNLALIEAILSRSGDD